MIYFKDPQITIRDLKPTDAPYLLSWNIDKELYKHDPIPRPSNTEELRKRCEGFCNTFNRNIEMLDSPEKKFHYFIITDNVDNPLGFVILFNQDKEKQEMELGVEIGNKRYWKKGLASKAISEIEKHIFTTKNIKRIFIETGEFNNPALKLFEKLNYNKCGESIENESFKWIVMEKLKE